MWKLYNLAAGVWLRAQPQSPQHSLHLMHREVLKDDDVMADMLGAKSYTRIQVRLCQPPPYLFGLVLR